MLPAHRSSVRLGRQAVLAWLQLEPSRYDVDTALLLVTELLATAVEYSPGPLVMHVLRNQDAMRVEVVDAAPGAAGSGSPYDPSPPDTGVSGNLHMINALASRWGIELRLVQDAPAARVVWFECAALQMDPVAGSSS